MSNGDNDRQIVIKECAEGVVEGSIPESWAKTIFSVEFDDSCGNDDDGHIVIKGCAKGVGGQ